MERTEGPMPYVVLLLGLFVNIVSLWNVKPVVIGIFVIGIVLGGIAGYKLAFDRIRGK